MIFACCHPIIPPDAQVALTLKVVSGFSISEIARAFLANDEAIAKMITRAKSKLRTENIRLEMPPPDELRTRLDSVLKVLYLIFNEGYSASEGSELVRKDLCFEAIRLAEFLASHPVTNSPKVHALAALFLFQGARLSSRCDHNGELLLLSEQDHSLWDIRILRRGLKHFRRSAAGDELTDYHLEAEIASLYALATDYASTDWKQIVVCYELLQSRKFSPVVELNRIVAVGQIDGPAKALEELSALGGNKAMSSFNLYYITRAHFLSEIGRKAEARLAYETAAKLTRNASVTRFIEKRLAELF
jgi:predicted RNA polymerase sigma factor